jgi:hypothetical protein
MTLLTNVQDKSGRCPSILYSVAMTTGRFIICLRIYLQKTEGATWFEKVNNGNCRSSHLLLRECYVGEAHDMRQAASATAKSETLFWKNEASFSFEKILTRISEAFKELEDAGQPLYKAQKVQQLLKSVKNDNVQVQTTLGIIETDTSMT